MPTAHHIAKPRKSGSYPGRESDCAAALRPAMSELAITQPKAVVAALGGTLEGGILELANAAVEAEWNYDEAVAAITRLARECEGAKGALFD